MNRFLILAAVLCMGTLSMNAQKGYEDIRHEVAVGIGVYSNSQWIDDLETVTTTFNHVTFDNESYKGPLSVEYFYHMKSWLGVGGIFAYGRHTQDVYYGQLKLGEAKDSYFTLMPAVKFDWLRKSHFGLYSKLAVGATLRSETIETVSQSMTDATESAVHFNWQASLLGFEAGSMQLRGFAELGVGEQGVIVAGVRYKF